MDNPFEINNNTYNINTNYLLKTNMDNIANNQEEIDWIIDRTPDLDFTPSFSNLLTVNVFDSSLIENHNIDEDDFIPFDYVCNRIHHPIMNETEVQKIFVSEEERNCPICFEIREREEISQINCGHKFCTICLTQYIRSKNRLACCPLCREIITKITFQTSYYEFYFLDV